MRDDLLHYYERELAYLRRSGAEFSRRYPKIASRLLLEPTKCDDPHVERLLEGFAFLAARVHLRIDDDFPEISEALLSVLYPQYVRPMPSMCVAEFRLDTEQTLPMDGYRIPRGTAVYSRPVDGYPCRFRTCYDTTVWPLRVSSARWTTPQELSPPVRSAGAVAALSVELECFSDVSFEELELDRLRFHINAESNVSGTLYELLFNNCREILVRAVGGKEEPVSIPIAELQPVGFAEDEGTVPLPRRSFAGYRLLQEYFVFPEKFHFFDVGALDRAPRSGDRMEIVFLFSSFERADRADLLETGITERSLRLGCSPMVNLFEKSSEPVLLTQRRHEYPVVADARRRAQTLIYSVDGVSGVTPGSSEPMPFAPLYSFRHGEQDTSDRIFWSSRRRASPRRGDESTDHLLSFVDLSGRPLQPDVDAVTARLTCYNGDLPSRLPFGNPEGDFELSTGGPVSAVVALVKPTEVVEPPLGKPQLWRLVSQLSLSFVSLVEGEGEALRELLRLHNFADSRDVERQIDGIVGLESDACHSRIDSPRGITFVRGQHVEVEFDEERFAGRGVFLFASVLERYLALSVTLNSFSKLSARTRQRSEALKDWPPRAGSKSLV